MVFASWAEAGLVGRLPFAAGSSYECRMAFVQGSRRSEGIVVRHQRSCPVSSGESCDCRPGYQAQVYSSRDHKTLRKTFATLSDARAWRAEAATLLQRERLGLPTKITLSQAADAWLASAQKGVVRTRSGDRYKPSALRGYEQALRTRLIPCFGHLKLTAITRNHVQDLCDAMVLDGLSPSTVRNAVLPLRAIYRRAKERSEVHNNPTLGLTLPAYRGRRDRVARPEEARLLLAALPEPERPLWACALYAGLRRGELRALRWIDIDLQAGVICVERSWDDKEGPVAPKSRAGRRRVPLAQPLRTFLSAHRLASASSDPTDLVFARADGRPQDTEWLTQRARKTWKRAGLTPVGLHECRHTYASLMLAAGVSAKALQVFMGHSSITMTLDRYGHLLPGSEDEAATLLADYLKPDETVSSAR